MGGYHCKKVPDHRKQDTPGTKMRTELRVQEWSSCSQLLLRNTQTHRGSTITLILRQRSPQSGQLWLSASDAVKQQWLPRRKQSRKGLFRRTEADAPLNFRTCSRLACVSISKCCLRSTLSVLCVPSLKIHGMQRDTASATLQQLANAGVGLWGATLAVALEPPVQVKKN